MPLAPFPLEDSMDEQRKYAILFHGFPPDGDRRILDDNFAIVAHPSGARTLNTAQRRGLLPIS